MEKWNCIKCGKLDFVTGGICDNCTTDDIVTTDISEIIDEPKKEMRLFFQHVYFTSRELLNADDAVYFTRKFICKYSGASTEFIIESARKYNMLRPAI